MDTYIQSHPCTEAHTSQHGAELEASGRQKGSSLRWMPLFDLLRPQILRMLVHKLFGRPHLFELRDRDHMDKRNTILILDWHELWLFLNIASHSTAPTFSMNESAQICIIRTPPKYQATYTYEYSMTFNLLDLLQKYFYLYVQHAYLHFIWWSASVAIASIENYSNSILFLTRIVTFLMSFKKWLNPPWYRQ